MIIKHVIISVAIPAACILTLLAGYEYRTQYARNEIKTYYSDDHSYRLVIYSIGEPEFPFGPGKCRFVLSGEGKKIHEFDFTMYNDGKWPDADNFDVSWMSDGVRIIVNGEEQEDKTYTLLFDGRILSEQ